MTHNRTVIDAGFVKEQALSSCHFAFAHMKREGICIQLMCQMYACQLADLLTLVSVGDPISPRRSREDRMDGSCSQLTVVSSC